MADRYSVSANTHRAPRPTFLRKLQEHAPNFSQSIGLMYLLITAAILLILAGLAVTCTILGLIFFTPLIVIASPIWIPVGTAIFLTMTSFLTMCGLALSVVAALSWMYRNFRGRHLPGSDRLDYARSRIYDTASHVKDCAKEYGGYLQSKAKDAAPGA